MRLGALVVPLLLFTPISGCFGGGDDVEPSPTPGDDGTRPVQLHIAFTDFNATAVTNETINIEWRIEISEGPAPNTTTPTTNTTGNLTRFAWDRLDQGNGAQNQTNKSVTVNTFVRFGFESVPEDNVSNAGAYSNETGRFDGVEAPGTYNSSFAVAVSGTVYLRAFAEENSTLHYSDEISIKVEAPPPPKITTVNIGGAGNGAGPVSLFTPRSVSIKVGEGVRWRNNDIAPSANSHAAASDTGAPSAFTAGPVPPGQTTVAIIFTKPGTYNYHCAVHPSTMTGQTGGVITVTA